MMTIDGNFKVQHWLGSNELWMDAMIRMIWIHVQWVWRTEVETEIEIIMNVTKAIALFSIGHQDYKNDQSKAKAKLEDTIQSSEFVCERNPCHLDRIVKQLEVAKRSWISH